MKFRPNADLMASVFVHLMLLALIFLYSEVHQFDPVAADTVPVEIVTPQEVAKSEVETKPEPAPSPSPTPELQLPSLDKPVDSAKPEPSAQAPAPQQNAQQQPPQKQATPPAPKPSPAPQRAAAEPPPAPAQQTPPMPQPTAQQQAAASPPAYAQPEPDLSVKYNVMLGLPPDISVKPPASAPSGLGPGKDNFDAAATEQADVGSSVVAEFRRHLKTCLKLPPTLSAGDDVKIKLRVFMKPDGKLAASPLLIEATASEKGPLLLKSATDALQACQPYAMLPRDRYGEWKVLDLDFSPRDFAS
ncbi:MULTISPECIES: hypothetical protein [Bradyrhizobium]|uniref:Cell envelope biogenesis protein TolA n=1 Tax=Bradyrhizobium brasilense TaxID=1419277 RepID=A0ABY8JS31_9BRAD|nr:MULTISPECIES: hypothetical protein [Bradyrhizobium]MCP1832526.1 outer membrane biosynthesis protein TonB [Bradyrhizobium sp. USDA 4545]MCP1917361.1 outer membrane biosynthesis protein TonB [Bradyrhizobium sp. USDA 4532]OMH99299.1 hypothetical protein BSN85_37325 [Bradyrhizobium brasilense]WFU67654.1 hypothetical protein QA636_20065 [Bradyrhizobium brasilense]